MGERDEQNSCKYFISYMSLMAKVRPCREGDEEDGVGEIVDFSMKAPKSLFVAIAAASLLWSVV